MKMLKMFCVVCLHHGSTRLLRKTDYQALFPYPHKRGSRNCQGADKPAASSLRVARRTRDLHERTAASASDVLDINPANKSRNKH